MSARHENLGAAGQAVAPGSLPYSLTDPYALRRTQGGAPVFPVADEVDARLLRSLAGFFGHAAEETNSLECGLPEPRNGHVVAVGETAAPAARLYAHLTGRGLKCVDSPASLDPEDPATRVVVAMADELNVDVLRALYDPGLRRHSVPGLLVAPMQEALRRAVLKSALAVRTGPRRPHPWVEILPLANEWRIADVDGRLVVGGRASAAAVRKALSLGADLLFASLHSDGLDSILRMTSLDDLAYLCPIKDQDLSTGDCARFPCVASNWCAREGAPLHEALAGETLVSIGSVRARVVVFQACYATRVGPGWFGSASSQGVRMLCDSTVGAVVSPWDLTHASQYDMEPLLLDITSGVPVGRALAAFHQTPIARERRTDLCLLGDPETALAPLPVPPSPGLTRRIWQAPDLAALSDPLGMVERALEGMRPNPIDRPATASWHDLRGRWVKAREENWAVREPVLRDIVERMLPYKTAWRCFIHPGDHGPVLVEGTPPCASCGTTTSHWILREAHGRGGHLNSCIHCGVVQASVGVPPVQLDLVRVAWNERRIDIDISGALAADARVWGVALLGPSKALTSFQMADAGSLAITVDHAQFRSAGEQLFDLRVVVMTAKGGLYLSRRRRLNETAVPARRRPATTA